MIKAIFFDLDATLLRMKQEDYSKAYLSKLPLAMEKAGYEPKEFLNVLWHGLGKMVKNDGSKLNCDVFWEHFTEHYGEGVRYADKYFEEFYKTDFKTIREITSFDPISARVVEAARAKGMKTVLATSPVFPKIATIERMSWAGLDPSLFDIITTYENSRLSKPNPAFYKDLADRLGLKPEECLMVGNDTLDDMVAREAGLNVYLVTDYLVNGIGANIEEYEHGTLSEFEKYLNERL